MVDVGVRTQKWCVADARLRRIVWRVGSSILCHKLLVISRVLYAIGNGLTNQLVCCQQRVLI